MSLWYKNLSPSERFWFGGCISTSEMFTYLLTMFNCTVRLAILLLNLHFRSISFKNYHSLTSNKFVFGQNLKPMSKKSEKSKPYTLLTKYNQMFTIKNVLNVLIWMSIRLRIQNGSDCFCTIISSEMVAESIWF